jgi:hypothetical protein
MIPTLEVLIAAGYNITISRKDSSLPIQQDMTVGYGREHERDR